MMRRLRLLFLIALMMPLAGCYESPDVVMHSPGEYRGKPDSKTIMHPTEEQRTALLERFRAIQTDR